MQVKMVLSISCMTMTPIIKGEAGGGNINAQQLPTELEDLTTPTSATQKQNIMP